MKVTPIDLRQQRFRKVFRGFDRAEVTALLNEVAEEYETALLEVDRLRQSLTQTEERLNEHRQREGDLRNTLITAQKLTEDFKDNAERQAQGIIRDAETRSELVLQKTQARLEEVQREIDGLRLKRRDVEASIEATIASLRNAIVFVREQDQRDREDRVLMHRPRQSDALHSPKPLDELLEVVERRAKS
jgi:cell division initiation protein